MKNSLVIFFGISLLFFSCKKDDDSDDSSKSTPAKTKTELLTNGEWKISAATIDPPIQVIPGFPAISDWYPYIDACVKDDLAKFNTDGTGTNKEGATKCDPNDPQEEAFEWFFNADETMLTQISADGDTSVVNLIQITETKAVLGEAEEIDGEKYIITLTAVHP